jgi:hypothetical protein
MTFNPPDLDFQWRVLFRNSSKFFDTRTENSDKAPRIKKSKKIEKWVDRSVDLRTYRTLLLQSYEPFKTALGSIPGNRRKHRSLGQSLDPIVRFERDWQVTLNPSGNNYSPTSIDPIAAVTELWPVNDRPRFEELKELGFIPVLIDLTKGSRAIEADIERILKEHRLKTKRIKQFRQKDSVLEVASNIARLAMRPALSVIPHPADKKLVETLGIPKNHDDLPWDSRKAPERLVKILSFLDPKNISLDWQHTVRTCGNKSEKTRSKIMDSANKAFKDKVTRRYNIDPASLTHPSSSKSSTPWD